MNNVNQQRRKMLKIALPSALMLSYFARQAYSDENAGVTSSNSYFALEKTAINAQVVIIGGGMAGAAAAKYCRLWGGSGLKVTMVEPQSSYTSNIMSNLVLSDAYALSSLQYSHQSLIDRYGVNKVLASVNSIDVANRRVSLSNGSSLSYDRLIVAPGVEFIEDYGLTQSDYTNNTPHAWQAGSQTALLRQQIQAMNNGDKFVMTIPKAPYRCPPGPYERACIVADYLKTAKGSNCRVIILDENLSIQAEVDNFTQAFNNIHAGIIDYLPGVSNIQINPLTKAVNYLDAVGATQSISAKVVNPIPKQRARGSANQQWFAAAGLNNSSDGRWAVVNPISYESTAVANIHVIGDAAQCGLPKAGHVANQEAKICADAIVQLLSGGQPDPQPVANSACYSPITRNTASWLTATYQYDASSRLMKVAANGGSIVGATAIEAASISSENYKDMQVWFNSLMGDTFA